MPAFDHRTFWQTATTWARSGLSVYVSEYQVPRDVPHTIVWEREKYNSLNKDNNTRVAVERLYRIG
ncbi:hypothetical protein OHB41_03750 [Streptomyces sp. NBC_01571]|uniref:hypothetical protein n=1 Tax=Streptomyces sp. NBC_01571 TaxID=2975883 RepID=UPI002258292F|nr:hypothetical protein [Streptomyces sp. NBC_01571]MCX4572313.1 hypothetical protein [Streptomyces sp. NBC_01571]